MRKCDGTSTTRLSIRLLRAPYRDTQLYPFKFTKGDEMILVFHPVDSSRSANGGGELIFSKVHEDVSLDLVDFKSESESESESKTAVISVEVAPISVNWCKDVFFGLNEPVRATLIIVDHCTHVNVLVNAHNNVTAKDLKFSGKPPLIQEDMARFAINAQRMGIN